MYELTKASLSTLLACIFSCASLLKTEFPHKSWPHSKYKKLTVKWAKQTEDDSREESIWKAKLKGSWDFTSFSVFYFWQV